ncbi:MAG TPA: hypothetical protein VFB44_16165 [Thermoleophilaceae bacterium]|nr:hypothetical protein [Thermoleophilaceae bacterium]
MAVEPHVKLVLCAVVSAVERVAGDHVDRFEDRRQGGAQRGHVTVRLVDVARDGGAQPGQPCERLGLGVDLGAPGGDLVDVLAQASLLGLGGRDRLGVLGQVALVSLRSEFAVLVVAVGLRQRGARPRRFGRRALGLLAGEGDLRVELSPDRAARPLDVEHPALEHAQRRGVHVRARQVRHRAGALPARLGVGPARVPLLPVLRAREHRPAADPAPEHPPDEQVARREPSRPPVPRVPRVALDGDRLGALEQLEVDDRLDGVLAGRLHPLALRAELAQHVRRPNQRADHARSPLPALARGDSLSVEQPGDRRAGQTVADELVEDPVGDRDLARLGLPPHRVVPSDTPIAVRGAAGRLPGAGARSHCSAAITARWPAARCRRLMLSDTT